jgi:hypothetical protein
MGGAVPQHTRFRPGDGGESANKRQKGASTGLSNGGPLGGYGLGLSKPKEFTGLEGIRLSALRSGWAALGRSGSNPYGRRTARLAGLR